MKLGSQTNSLTNHILSRAVIGQPEPALGMGVTLLSWTDRDPGTIVGVFTAAKMIKVREDHATRMDKNGLSESQTYQFRPNHTGHVYTFRQNKSGVWEEVEYNPLTNRYRKTGGHGLRIGERSAYRDPSF
jgi:hypothetical protein